MAESWRGHYEHWRNVTREHLIHRFSNPRWQILNDWFGSNFHIPTTQHTSALRRRNGPSLLVQGVPFSDPRAIRTLPGHSRFARNRKPGLRR
jgi:hypothetical protein